jgi:hypothetical protein
MLLDPTDSSFSVFRKKTRLGGPPDPVDPSSVSTTDHQNPNFLVFPTSDSYRIAKEIKTRSENPHSLSLCLRQAVWAVPFCHEGLSKT